MTRPTRAIHLSSRYSGEAHARAFGTPDRAITVIDARRSASEALARSIGRSLLDLGFDWTWACVAGGEEEHEKACGDAHQRTLDIGSGGEKLIEVGSYSDPRLLETQLDGG